MSQKSLVTRMIVNLGIHLDGQRGWRAANRLGEVTVGPAGLLGILELQLGLSRESASAAERVVQFRDCLKRCDAEKRFYHRTFEADELGTAATLLLAGPLAPSRVERGIRKRRFRETEGHGRGGGFCAGVGPPLNRGAVVGGTGKPGAPCRSDR